MRERLERDGFLFQMFNLAARHGWPLRVVRRMSIDEFYGWLAYHQMEKEANENG